MTDQAQRLEIATVRAEIGSNITYRFNNDAIDAVLIPTDSGDIKNLKQVIAGIQQEGADKISFATKIYQTTAAGIAATINGEIFLVASSDVDEIYAVWQNSSGTAVDTGKRAISASAVIAATDAAQASAASAQSAADQASSKVAPFLSPSPSNPVSRDDGSALQRGDNYFNTLDQAIKVYSASGWVSANVTGSDLASAINTREPSIPPGTAGQYWADDKTFKTLDKSSVGLNNADNTSDANKPVSTATQTALNARQLLAANLTAFAGLSGVADAIAYFTAAGTMALTSLTSQARTFLAATTAAAQRAALGLGNAAVRDSRALPLEILTPADTNDGVAAGWKSQASYSGSGQKINYFEYNIKESSDTTSKVNGIHLMHNFGGPQARGGRHGIEATLLQGYGGPGATASDNTDRFYVPIQGQVLSDSGDGGTSASDLRGAYFGGSSYAGILANATWTANVTGWEFNTYIAAGSGNRVSYHSGFQVASFIGERGFNADCAIAISNLGGSPMGWKYGVLCHDSNGRWPFDADSTFLKIQPQGASQLTNLIDAIGVDFSGNVIGTNYVRLTDGTLSLLKSGSQINIGATAAASNVSTNYRSGGLGAAYDSRWISIGGSAAAGGGTVQLDGAGFILAGTITRPGSDNTATLGTTNFRWSVVYAGTGTINTSDAREKTKVRSLEYRELDAAKRLGREIGAFQFLDAIKAKGEDARLHIGMTVQRAIEVMEGCGLDPLNYAFICHDEWGATDEVTNEDEDGNSTVVMPYSSAGDRYGFRMDELLAFIAVGFEARLSALEAK